MKIKNTLKYNLNNNGFSLVELLVAVAILSVIVVPIMRSFTTAAITSSKAQSMQNATSIAEKVMEEVKSISGKDVQSLPSEEYTKKDSDGNIIQDSDGNNITYKEYRKKYLNKTATSGEKFDVYVEINDLYYSENEGTSDVSDINSLKFPELYAVDSDKHIVISWEINNYDASAVETVAYKANVSKDDVKKKENGEKITRINLTGGGVNPSDTSKLLPIVATCDVEYKYEDPLDSSKNTKLNYTVFNKNVFDIAIEKDKKGNGGPNVYLFYTTSNQINNTDYFENEKIIITDDTETPSIEGKLFKHDYYVIVQNLGDNNKVPITPSVQLDGGASCNGSLYSNITGNTVYQTEKKQRVYDVKVKVYKAGTYLDSEWPVDGDNKKKLAELNSTMRVH